MTEIGNYWTLESRAEHTADTGHPALTRGGYRWRRLYKRALRMLAEVAGKPKEGDDE